MERAHELTSRKPEKSSSPANDGHEIADFECNICFDLAQDPVITLCGHLHCWPCLYKWLKLHSQCHECPVCKALIEEETLIPLYGRGDTTAEPRLIPTLDIPHRPTGQRPETAPPPPPPEANNLTDTVYRRIDGFIPMGPPAFSRFTMSAGFGGVLSPVFGFHEFADETRNGADETRNGGSSGFHYGEGGGRREDSVVGQRNDDNLKKILVFVLLFVLFDFLTI